MPDIDIGWGVLHYQDHPELLARIVGTELMLKCIDARLHHERRALLPRIQAATLILALKDDVSTPPHCSEELAALIPGSILRPRGETSL